MNKGDQVILTDNVRHAEYRGMRGTIKRIVKSRNVITIVCENGEYYDALPENVRRVWIG